MRFEVEHDDAALEPVSVGLQFGFLAVLYLFLLWVSRSALRDLRRSAARGSSARRPGRRARPGRHEHLRRARTAAHGDGEPRLIVERAPGHTPGMEYDIGEGAVMGRGDQAEIRLEDPFASSRHARLLRQGGIVVLEDLGSTNGTYLNEELADRPAAAAPRRPRADRRQRVHLRRPVDAARRRPLRAHRHRARRAAPTRTRSSRARRCSRSPTAWAARRPGEVASQIAVEVLQQGLPERDGSVEQRLARARRGGQRADQRAVADRRRSARAWARR